MAYEEKQVFQLNWIFIPIAIFTIVPTLLLSKGPGMLIALLICGVTTLLVGFLLFSMRQTIRIDEQGVHYQQKPFHRKFYTIPWTDIQNWKVVKINAFGDFGGWGIRKTMKKNGYIIEGEFGLELKTSAKRLTVLSVKNKVATEQSMEAFS